MHRFSQRSERWWTSVAGVVVACGMVACGASPVGGPDPARSTYFKGTQVDGTNIPYRFLFYPNDFAFTYLTEARLVPLDLGRTTDARIFDDRGGSGTPGGNGRDTTVSTGRMSDIRTFSTAPVGGNFQTDSVVVDVVRKGDTLYITRAFPDAARNVTDTAWYEAGVLVRPLAFWRYVNEVKTGRKLVYTTVK